MANYSLPVVEKLLDLLEKLEDQAATGKPVCDAIKAVLDALNTKLAAMRGTSIKRDIITWNALHEARNIAFKLYQTYCDPNARLVIGKTPPFIWVES